ncbi:hypothetical protein ACFWCB_05900 [Streptomyces sp. NPDC060048]|uniref:hypothetical protein n=1 Tax=unclassified Streptomyces TaxID=2593676 RepID=UPI0036CC7845
MTRPDHVLAVLRRNPDLVRLAAGSFDFDLDRAEHVEEVRLASGAPLRAVAGDDTGGTYFICADGAVLYASSEGEAGLIGASMDEALEILFGLPGWHDYTETDVAADDEALEAVFNRTEDEIWDSYGPELDADRSTLLSVGSAPAPQEGAAAQAPGVPSADRAGVPAAERGRRLRVCVAGPSSAPAALAGDSRSRPN